MVTFGDNEEIRRFVRDARKLKGWDKVIVEGGDIRIVEPTSVFKALREKTSTLNVFETYKTVEEAVNSFN